MQDLMAVSVATLVGHLQFPHIQISCYNNSEKSSTKNAVTGVTALPALYQLYGYQGGRGVSGVGGIPIPMGMGWECESDFPCGDPYGDPKKSCGNGMGMGWEWG